MPSCFQLTRKSTPDIGAILLAQIDNEMRAHFGVPADSSSWYHNWYNTIGFFLALGKSFDDLRKLFREPGWDHADELIKIVDWLDENFTVKSWYEVKQ